MNLQPYCLQNVKRIFCVSNDSSDEVVQSLVIQVHEPSKCATVTRLRQGDCQPLFGLSKSLFDGGRLLMASLMMQDGHMVFPHPESQACFTFGLKQDAPRDHCVQKNLA